LLVPQKPINGRKFVAAADWTPGRVPIFLTASSNEHAGFVPVVTGIAVRRKEQLQRQNVVGLKTQVRVHHVFETRA